ncbi:peroxide stress protein YaaA [Clostridium paraputrificum]|uniref:peroxide stress protein YaaA n=1 Tax=Clostridium TaxID=1485 RepID=UPI003D34E999
MLMILSPAKTLDLSIEDIQRIEDSQLAFKDETKELVSILQGYSIDELAKLMKMSEKLAILNYDRFRNFYEETTKEYTSILAFKGEAYKGLAVEDFTEDDLQYAQKNLRILSGLYGVIHPLDKIKEYRLEMGTKLKNNLGTDLYSFWGEKITIEIEEGIKSSCGEKVLINLASKEYSSALNINRIKEKYKVVDISFMENRNGEFKLVGTYAKKARGIMVRYIIKNRINSIEEIKEFNEEGYLFNKQLSSDDTIIFTR